MDDLIQDFIAETREGLEALDCELVRFEQEPDDPQLLGGIFRLIHTIKGTSGFLSLSRLQTVAHAAENVLGAFRDGELAVSAEAVSAILETVDLIRGLIDDLHREPVAHRKPRPQNFVARRYLGKALLQRRHVQQSFEHRPYYSADELPPFIGRPQCWPMPFMAALAGSQQTFNLLAE